MIGFWCDSQKGVCDWWCRCASIRRRRPASGSRTRETCTTLRSSRRDTRVRQHGESLFLEKHTGVLLGYKPASAAVLLSLLCLGSLLLSHSSPMSSAQAATRSCWRRGDPSSRSGTCMPCTAASRCSSYSSPSRSAHSRRRRRIRSVSIEGGERSGDGGIV